VGGHLETSQPALATGQAMKKDSPWTQKNDQGQRTENYDQRHLINNTDTRLEFGIRNINGQQVHQDDIRTVGNVNQMKHKDDNDTQSVSKTCSNKKSRTDIIFQNFNEIRQQNFENGSLIVQRTDHMNTDSRKLPLFKIGIKENVSITKPNIQERLNRSIHEKLNNTNGEIYKKHEHLKRCIIGKEKRKRKNKLRNKIGENLNLFLILLISIPPIHSYSLRGKAKGVHVVEKHEIDENSFLNKNRVEGFDNDTLTNITNNQTTTCYCPTTQQPTSEPTTPTSRPTATGTTTLSGRCLCPGSVQSLAEEETATNMPNTGGRRRRRKDIEGMDLFVDGFDQKMLKKMPFLGSY